MKYVSFLLIFTTFIAVQSNEIEISYDYDEIDSGHNTVVLFCHGLGLDGYTGQFYMIPSEYYPEKAITIPNSLITFDFPEAGKCKEFFGGRIGMVDRKHIFLAQGKDLEYLHGAINQVRSKFPEKKIVLYGVSRGASAIVSYLGNSAYAPFTNIAAAIMESPFDNLENTVRNVMSRFYLGYTTPICYWLLQQYFHNYSKNGLHPIDVASKISQGIPLLFVASKEDQLIHYEQTESLFSKTIEAGHPNAHFLLVPKGTHCFIKNGPNAADYEIGVSLFYKRYKLFKYKLD